MNMHEPRDELAAGAIPADPPHVEVGAEPASTKARKRKRLLAGLGAVTLLAGGGWWAYDAFFAADAVSTENAYTAVEVAQVTPLVGGPVRDVQVVDTQAVRAGQVLVMLDDTDAKLAVASAQAELARAERRVRQLFANDDSLAGQLGARTADVASAEADLGRARADLQKAELDAWRRRELAKTGTVSREALTNAETALRVAQAAVAQGRAKVEAAKAARAAAVGAREANTVLIAGTSVENHPEVLAARTRFDQARVDLERTVIRAPFDGVVAQRSVEIGQRVQPGQRLMAVVPVERIYVDANFKEGQLREVRVGQPVHLTSDLYGDEVVYTGRVVGFSGGSGSAFAAIPAQNATGNWIKVVQRLPVRIELDGAQLRAHPLRVGLSMHATVDLSDRPQQHAAAAGLGR